VPAVHVAEPAAGLLRVRRRGSVRLAQGVAAAWSLMSSIRDQSEFLIYDESVCSRLRVGHSSRCEHSLIPRTRWALHPAVGLLVCLRERECFESCAEPSAVLAHSSYTALYKSECQVQSLHKCQVPIQILTNTKPPCVWCLCTYSESGDRRSTRAESVPRVPQAARRGQDTPGPAAVRGEERGRGGGE
jgi:hypothetical protein